MSDQKTGFWNKKSIRDISAGIAILIFLCGIQHSLEAQGSISINNDGAPPDSSAILDLSSTSMGLLVPRMTSVERSAISGPATGLIVYDLNESSLYCYAGSNWIKVMSGATTVLVDNDGDTKIDVEQTPDEDIIRFDTEGTERWVMKGSRLEPSNSSGSVFIGNNAGAGDSLLENSNVAIGRAALESSSGHRDVVAIGDSSLFNNGIGATNPTSGYENTAIGSKSMLSNKLGHSNTAVGTRTLYSNHSADFNTAVGIEALYLNYNGDYNTAVGSWALRFNDDGENNSAFGTLALYLNTEGDKNSAFGAWSMHSNSIGDQNTASGYFSLFDNSAGDNNSAYGFTSLFNNTIGNENTAIGTSALFLNTEGSFNTAIGRQSLYSNLTGNDNTASGGTALYSNTTGSRNSASGTGSLYSNTTGNENTAVGVAALSLNTSRANLVAIGDSALYNNGTGATQSFHATQNTAIGSKSLYSNTIGYRNTASGFEALYSNISGNHNTAIGSEALFSSETGNFNTVSGSQAMFSNTGGYDNTASGYRVLYSNTDGYRNTAMGRRALYNNNTGSNNVAMGRSALFSNTSGGLNVAIGGSALSANQAGSRNVAIGFSAGSGTGTHSKTGNVYIGYYAGYNDTTDNKLYIDNSSTSSPLIYGDFASDILAINGKLGAGTTNPATKLHVNGGTDTELTGGGYLTLGSIGGANISIDNNEIQARNNSAAITLHAQAGGGDFHVHFGLAQIEEFVVKGDGKTGIGLGSPSDKLHVNSDVGQDALRVQVDGSTKFRIHDSGGISIFSSADPGAGIMRIETGSDDLIIGEESSVPVIRPHDLAAGYVGTALHPFAGMHAFSFTGTLNSPSDLRLKENVRPIDDPIQILKSINGVSYAFKKEHFYKANRSVDEYRRTHQLGVIAQDLEKVLPELVHTSDETGLKSVEYIGMIPILIEAVKEQQQMIDDLNSENEDLKSQLDTISVLIAELQSDLPSSGQLKD